ncbi:MAG: ABC transporter permease [Sphaerochaetaceae bacterium]
MTQNSLTTWVLKRKYFLIKITRALLTGFIILILSFILMRASGNPAEIYLGSEATDEAVAYFNHEWGLDRSISHQFISYLGNILRFDFGNSLLKKQPVTQIFKQHLGPTLSLMIPVALLAITGGIFFGMVAARNYKKPLDTGLMIFTTIGFSLPNFFFGVLLIFLFSITLGILPSSGNLTWKHCIMPIFTIMTADIAVFVHFTRSATLQVYNQHFIMSFRALGISEKRILLRHVFPNASISLLTISGFYIGSLITGAIVTETIFSWPGLGSLLVSSMKARDFPVVQALIIIFGFSIVGMNLLIDVLYGVMDPRIRKGGQS